MQEQWEGVCSGLGDRGGSSYQDGNGGSGQKWLDTGDTLKDRSNMTDSMCSEKEWSKDYFFSIWATWIAISSNGFCRRNRIGAVVRIEPHILFFSQYYHTIRYLSRDIEGRIVFRNLEVRRKFRVTNINMEI